MSGNYKIEISKKLFGLHPNFIIEDSHSVNESDCKINTCWDAYTLLDASQSISSLFSLLFDTETWESISEWLGINSQSIVIAVDKTKVNATFDYVMKSCFNEYSSNKLLLIVNPEDQSFDLMNYRFEAVTRDHYSTFITSCVESFAMFMKNFTNVKVSHFLVLELTLINMIYNCIIRMFKMGVLYIDKDSGEIMGVNLTSDDEKPENQSMRDEVCSLIVSTFTDVIAAMVSYTYATTKDCDENE